MKSDCELYSLLYRRIAYGRIAVSLYRFFFLNGYDGFFIQKMRHKDEPIQFFCEKNV